MMDITIAINSMRQLSTTLRDARRGSGLTQAELAGMIGVSRPWINQLEQGRIANPGMQRILAICDALHVRITMTYEVRTQDTGMPSAETLTASAFLDSTPFVPVGMAPPPSEGREAATPERQDRLELLATANIPGLDDIKRMAETVTTRAAALNAQPAGIDIGEDDGASDTGKATTGN